MADGAGCAGIREAVVDAPPSTSPIQESRQCVAIAMGSAASAVSSSITLILLSLSTGAHQPLLGASVLTLDISVPHPPLPFLGSDQSKSYLAPRPFHKAKIQMFQQLH